MTTVSPGPETGATEDAMSPLLAIDGLRVDLTSRTPHLPLVDDVSFTVGQGESVGLVGESGSGKSMTVRAAMRLLPDTVAATGGIRFEGRSVLGFSSRELARYRAGDVAMIHQDPRAHTNPLHTIGDFLIEGTVTTGRAGRREATEAACQLLAEMGIGDARARLDQYPHQLSGGLLQRVMIAMALMNKPMLVFADEPTTALDVTVQSEVMAILVEQIAERDTGMVFITHDLDLAAAVTDTLVVMYAGTVVERGGSAMLYDIPRHPYTAALLAARPSTTAVRRLVAIPGRPAAASEVGGGCVFAARCQFATERCHIERPELRWVDARAVACHRAEEIADRVQDQASR
ncbi:MAG: ABC transporter ATP-binding protein [Nocardioides sp.]|uniref:ABC transporter ATP-binding protein n=1 Tax=Nocardioides sp. TaxID=35761 RepID=UPI0039E3BCE7